MQMASQSMHIVEFRTEAPPTPPPYDPNPVYAPIQSPETNATLQARNDFNRALGIGQTVDVVV